MNSFFRCGNLPDGHGAETSEDRVHPSPNTGAGEGVPLQPILDATKTHRDRTRALFVRTANQNLVPESTDEVQKGQQAAQHQKRPTQDQPGRSHDHRQSQDVPVEQPGDNSSLRSLEFVLVERGRDTHGSHGRRPLPRQHNELAAQPATATTAAAPLRRQRRSPAAPSPSPNSPSLRRRRRGRCWCRRSCSKQLSTSGKYPTQARTTLWTHVIVNLTTFIFEQKQKQNKQKLILHFLLLINFVFCCTSFMV